jgi:hypothetical protein
VQTSIESRQTPVIVHCYLYEHGRRLITVKQQQVIRSRSIYSLHSLTQPYSAIFAGSILLEGRRQLLQAPGWTSGGSSREHPPGLQMREYVRSTIYYLVGRTYYSITGTTSTTSYLGTKGWWYSLQVLIRLAISNNHRHDQQHIRGTDSYTREHLAASVIVVKVVRSSHIRMIQRCTSQQH